MTLHDSSMLNIVWLCGAAGVSRSGYYSWLGAVDTRERREEKDKADFALIKDAYEFRGYDKGSHRYRCTQILRVFFLQIQNKVVNRLRQVTSAIMQEGVNQVNVTTNTAEREAAVDFGKAAAIRPQIVGQLIHSVSRDKDVCDTMFSILEINQMVSCKMPIHLLPENMQFNLKDKCWRLFHHTVKKRVIYIDNVYCFYPPRSDILEWWKTIQQRSSDMWQCPKCGRCFNSTGQNHYCAKLETIDQYILDQPEQVQPVLRRIREIMRREAPDAAEKMSWQMPTYWQGGNIIHFAAFKKHVSIYPGADAVAFFAGQLTGYKTAKGTIQLPLDKPIPYELIAQITHWCVANMTEEEK